ETVTFTIFSRDNVSFPLYLRIPGWCEKAAVKVNGKPLSVNTWPLSYLVIDRRWHDGDRVTLELPMSISVKRWPKNMNAASVDYGPLSFSLKIDEDWRKYGNRANWSEYEVY